jgi:hypothetical protein
VPRKPLTAEEILARMVEEVADDLLAVDDVALADLLRDSGIDEQRLLAEGQQSIAAAAERADAAVRQRVRKDFENASTAAVERAFRLPSDLVKRRRLLTDAVRRNPGLGPGVTLQHRDLSELSDDDVTKQLEKLVELGLIGDEGDSD